jgi:hypothetical protein
LKKSRFQPDDLGDLGVRHEVNVFVYRDSHKGIEYLLLRPNRRSESLWRPVVKPIGLDQDLRSAAIWAVRAETGLNRAFDLYLPAAGVQEDVGDLHLVGWPIGFRLRDPQAPIQGRPELVSLDWMDFDQALQQIGLSVHRQNLLQLHWQLAA